MDVTGTGQAAAAAASSVVTGSVPTAPAPQAPSVVATSQTGAATTASAGAGQTPTAAGASESRTGLAPAIAKLFGSSSPTLPIRLDVSYRVLRDPDQIVTVFSDPSTGREVAQFPPDILINIAQFFDQQSGVTLDRDA